MAQSNTGDRAAYVYAPGDGRRYVWYGGATIGVFRVADVLADFDHAAPVDTIPAEGVARTLTAFLAVVDAWRADQ